MLNITPTTPLSHFPISYDSSSNTSDSEQDDYDFDYQNQAGPSRSRKGLVTTPGEIISSSNEYMRGHGTFLSTSTAVGTTGGEGSLVRASVAGTIERVNKLVSVKPCRSRYLPQVGDLLIARVQEVQQTRWKLDIGSKLSAQMLLGSVNLPGSQQKRKTEGDALRMREFLGEGDLLAAEVQKIQQEGPIHLHTRSLKIGKLRNGRLLIISPSLIRRMKSHVVRIPIAKPNTEQQQQQQKIVDVILGLNGFIWVSVGMLGDIGEDNEGMNDGSASASASTTVRGGGVIVEGLEGEGSFSNENDDISPSSRLAISQMSYLISLFSQHLIPLTDILLKEGYEWIQKRGSKFSGNDFFEELLSGRGGLGEELIRDLTGAGGEVY